MSDSASRLFVELHEPPAESALRHFLARRSVLDQSPLAIVEVDLALRVLYANPTALTIVGADDYHDIVLDDVFPDAESQERLQLERARRREGLIGNYEVKVTRLSDHSVVPVEITAVPLANTAGEVTGSIAILRSLERRDLRLDIHRLNNEIDNGHALIARVSQRLKKVIPFADLVVVSRFSQGQRHARVIFAQPIETGRVPDRGKRWIPLSDHQIAWLHAEETRLIGDMEALLEREPWSSMKDDSFVKSLLNAGMKSSVRRSIVRGGKLVATFSLLSRSADAFTRFHRDLLDEVPIEASVLQALDFEEKQLRDQRMRLVVDINRCTKVDTAAKLLAKRLVGIFGWAHVSIFKVEHSKGRLGVIGQDYDEAQRVHLDRDYSQSIDTGILGRVVPTREGQSAPDVSKDKD